MHMHATSHRFDGPESGFALHPRGPQGVDRCATLAVVAATIEHQPAKQRFEATLDGHHGRIEYRVDSGVMTIEHTEVDRALEGRGVAGALVRGALDHARREGLRVEAECSYTRTYMERHPETLDLRA